MITQLRGRSQITIPSHVIKKLGLKEGDHLNIDIENGNIIIKPVIVLPKDQAWFWTDKWQAEERQVDKEIIEGEIRSFNSMEDLIEDLDN